MVGFKLYSSAMNLFKIIHCIYYLYNFMFKTISANGDMHMA